MRIDTKYGGVAFLNGYAGILTFWRSGKSYLHLGVKPNCWTWGKCKDPFENLYYRSYGFGPLFLYVRELDDE